MVLVLHATCFVRLAFNLAPYVLVVIVLDFYLKINAYQTALKTNIQMLLMEELVKIVTLVVKLVLDHQLLNVRVATLVST